MKERMENFEPSAKYEKTKELVNKMQSRIREVSILINQARDAGIGIQDINHPYVDILARNIGTKSKMISLFEIGEVGIPESNGNQPLVSDIQKGIQELELLITEMKESGIVLVDLYERYNN